MSKNNIFHKISYDKYIIGVGEKGEKVYKLPNVFFSMIIIVGFVNKVNAENVQPVYDTTFNKNNGIFYANGNDITINKDKDGETVVSWKDGNQKVEETVTIVGGGKEGTSFEKSNIIMEDGVVSHIYGGGVSLVENNSANVKNSNIVINNGTVTSSVIGGGLIYTNVENSNIVINNGTVSDICGGGLANAVISDIAYSVGTEEGLEASKNRVTNSNITINGGTIDRIPSNYGSVFGGGQGYSYTQNAKIVINDGALSKAYVTAGGANGYTKDAKLEINGGDIYLLQSVNRGKIENVDVEITGGNIDKAYIGGETEDSTVNGEIENVNFRVLSGSINNLETGTNKGERIEIDQDKYKVITVNGTVENSNIGEKEIKVDYELFILEDKLELYQGVTQKINYKIKTNPEEYQYLFADKPIYWISEEDEIALVNQDGIITTINPGTTTVLARLLDKEDSV